MTKTTEVKNGYFIITILQDNGVLITRRVPLAVAQKRLTEERTGLTASITTLQDSIAKQQEQLALLQGEKSAVDEDIAKL